MAEDAAARHLLDGAERAATAGDFASAYDLLRGALRHQEKKLGARHPDLANTLNNLAVVAERTGREKEAGPLYRRAAAIAEAAFPPDHPMVVASRQNLEDFCQARGLPIDPSPEAPAPDDVVRAVGDSASSRETGNRLRLDAPLAEPPAQTAPIAAASREVVANDVAAVTTPPAAPAAPVADVTARPATPSERVPTPRPASRASRPLVWLACAVAMALVAALLMLRPGSPGGESTAQSEPAAAAPAAAEPQPPAPSVRSSTAPRENVPPSTAPPAGADRSGTTRTSAAGSGLTIVTAEVCRTFSASGRNWRCEPVGESVAAGRVVFYTRLRSTRSATVLHRWYRGGTLRRTVKLTTAASAREGYRTYSRQTVDRGDWRVELTTANGDLLHEERFVVR
jgi:hypothetical protein